MTANLPRSTEKVLLLDAYNLLFRSFSILPRTIASPEGEPVHGVYGLLSSIVALWRDYHPSAIVAAFDLPETPTFRQQLFSSYQAQRGPLGGEHAANFRWQVDLAYRILPSLQIPALAVPEFEADDVMGTMAVTISDRGGTAHLVSTDRDLTQLVRPGIAVLVPGKEARVIETDADVRALLGVPAAGVTTFKALAGDASDNIPGVPGIGRKRAAELVNPYGSLEQIYEAVDELPPRIGNALAAARDDAFLFRHLVTIQTALELEVDAANLPVPRVTEESRARQILEQVEYGRAL